MQINSMTEWSLLSLVLIVTALAVHLLSKFSGKLGLLAEPGEHRAHQTATPMVGGIAIYLGLLLGMLLIDNSFSSLLPSLFLMCAVGALDDRYNLPSWARFLAQGIAAYLIIALGNVALLDLGYLFSSDQRILLSPLWSTAITVFACIGVINAVNMSDGLDGLAGSLVFLVLLSLLLLGHPSQGLILISLTAIAGFLVWNIRVGRPRAKAFMGDAGSTMLGLLMAYLLIGHSQISNGIWPVTALWLLALPLIDAVAVLIVRPLRGRSPFSADRIHYHHQLLDRGISVNLSLIIALVVQSIFVLIGIALWRISFADHLQLALFLGLFSLYAARLYHFSGKFEKTN
jgi:UDP-GlcNAc:undecaprenyl-phosphate GlcNAc-1-phosphate transferase